MNETERRTEQEIAREPAATVATDTAGSVTGGVRILLRLEGLTLFIGMAHGWSSRCCSSCPT
jgi:hypothetical protein